MVRWASAPKPTTPAAFPANPYRRSVAMTELYAGIANRPANEHATWLIQFAEKYPNYPTVPARCPCSACLVARTVES